MVYENIIEQHIPLTHNSSSSMFESIHVLVYILSNVHLAKEKSFCLYSESGPDDLKHISHASGEVRAVTHFYCRPVSFDYVEKI